MKTVGIDIGYGFMKISDENGVTTLPSVLGEGKNLTFESNMGESVFDIDKIKVEFEGKSYFVGNFAILQSNNAYRSVSSDRATNINAMILFLTGLAISMGDEDREDFFVVTGLPVQEFTMYKDEYMEKFSGTHTIKLNGKKKIINVEEIVVVPQPYGTFCMTLSDEDYNAESVGIIDVGYGTSDFIQINNNDYLDRYSKTSPNGMKIVYQELSEHLASEHGLNKEDFELEKIVQTGYVKRRRKDIDVKKVIEASKKSLAVKIASEVRTLWNNYDEIDDIIITGGGGEMLKKALSEALEEELDTFEDSQSANSRGYREWGLFIQEFQRSQGEESNQE